jgi:hypothetical protein
LLEYVHWWSAAWQNEQVMTPSPSHLTFRCLQRSQALRLRVRAFPAVLASPATDGFRRRWHDGGLGVGLRMVRQRVARRRGGGRDAAELSGQERMVESGGGGARCHTCTPHLAAMAVIGCCLMPVTRVSWLH